MEGNPEPESVRGEQPLETEAEAKAPADINLPSEPLGTQGQLETEETQVEDPAKEHVKSWIESQTETQPQQPPTDSGDAKGDDTAGELPRVETDAPSTVPDMTGTAAENASTTTSAPPQGTDATVPAPAPAPAPAAEAGVGVVTGPALITPRRRAASTSTGPSPSTSAAGHGHVPHFVAPSSYLRRRTSIRSPMAPTEPKPLSPLDRDQLQGLVCIIIYLPFGQLVSSHPYPYNLTWGTRAPDG
jgi:hypothetical protein